MESSACPSGPEISCFGQSQGIHTFDEGISTEACKQKPYVATITEGASPSRTRSTAIVRMNFNLR